MAPPKSSRNAHDDKDTKDKDKANASGTPNTSAKMRRVASQQAARERERERDQANITSSHSTNAQEPVSVQWHALDRKFLHAYRRQYNLDTPSSFVESYHHFVLARPGGIGLYSPTMARRKRQQRQTREQLAFAVRKHFNSVGVQENDVIVDLIHAVHERGGKKRSRPADGP